MLPQDFDEKLVKIILVAKLFENKCLNPKTCWKVYSTFCWCSAHMNKKNCFVIVKVFKVLRRFLEFNAIRKTTFITIVDEIQ